MQTSKPHAGAGLNQGAGVDYDKIDPFKVECQKAARETAAFLRVPGFSLEPSSIGESASLINCGDFYLATVLEALGTKHAVANTMALMAGRRRPFFREVALSTASTILNDLATCGAQPLVMHVLCAPGESSWFANVARRRDFIAGMVEACRIAGCAWPGGESPALHGTVHAPDDGVFAGCAVGVVSRRALISATGLRPGLVMVGLGSSGVHENGYTAIREQVAPAVGYDYRCGSTTFGAAVLRPGHLYGPVIRECQNMGIRVEYVANITGHGIRKGLRGDSREPLEHRVTWLPKPQREFDIIAQVLGKTPEQMYASFNMGIGYILWVVPQNVRAVISIARALGLRAWKIGETHAVRKGGSRMVIKPLKIVYESEALKLR